MNGVQQLLSISQSSHYLAAMIRIVGLAAVGVVAAAGLVGGDLLDATTHVSLGSALSVGGVVAGAVWWFGRKFQQIEDRDIEVHRALAAKEETDKLRFDSIARRVDNLPCQDGDCLRPAKKASPPP
jgi:hypothetical protein